MQVLLIDEKEFYGMGQGESEEYLQLFMVEHFPVGKGQALGVPIHSLQVALPTKDLGTQDLLSKHQEQAPLTAQRSQFKKDLQ